MQSLGRFQIRYTAYRPVEGSAFRERVPMIGLVEVEVDPAELAGLLGAAACINKGRVAREAGGRVLVRCLETREAQA